MRSLIARVPHVSAALPPLPRTVITIILGALVTWLALGILQQLAVVLVAKSLARLSDWEALQRAVAAAPGDDLHGLLALQMLGDAEGAKLALRFPGAEPLAASFPTFFGPPQLLAASAWAGAVFPAASSAVGAHLLGVLANLVFVFFGVALAAAGATSLQTSGTSFRRGRTLLLCGVGVLSQAYGVLDQLRLTWTEGGGETVLRFLATKVFGLDGSSYDALASGAGGFFSLALNLAVLVPAFFFSLVLWRFLLDRKRALPALPAGHATALLMLPSRLPGPLTLIFALLLFQTPWKATSTFEAVPPSSWNAPFPVSVKASRKPSVVAVVPKEGGFEYRVNGQRTWIRGIGYNSMISQETQEERLAQYDRDFALLRASGVNTILGWDQEEFDEVLLVKAAEYDLGVILPFELEPTWEYADAVVRARLLEEIKAWVEGNKASPSLRMWGLGNEVIHGIGDVQRKEAKAFARFLVEAADLVHKLDPDHPVIYRGAEDVYLEPVARALARDGVPRPWFVYGMNFFSTRIGQALEDGPTSRLRQPLLISEFGPAGVWPPHRPAAYLKQWGLIRAFPQKVLGGCAYVWTTEGPEPLDRSFGLVDESGVPVDGALFALASAFLQEEQAERNAGVPATAPASPGNPTFSPPSPRSGSKTE